jgi:DNA topoisomerase-1
MGSFIIEPPTLFKGRGKHPKAGIMKARIRPEQLTINVSADAPIPRCHVDGHNWKKIVHENTVTWLAGYKDNTIGNHHKYIFLNAASRFKCQNDIKKYDKARRLKD